MIAVITENTPISLNAVITFAGIIAAVAMWSLKKLYDIATALRDVNVKLASVTRELHGVWMVRDMKAYMDEFQIKNPQHGRVLPDPMDVWKRNRITEESET